MLLTTTLRRKGYDVIGSETGAGGIREAQRGSRPDVISLDLSLPDISSVKVIPALKADLVIRLIPIMIGTASVDGDLRQQVLDRGAVEILTKPVQSCDLFAALNRQLQRDCGDRSAENNAA
jgi:CheY-like chemotaxis protein